MDTLAHATGFARKKARERERMLLLRKFHSCSLVPIGGGESGEN